MIDTYTAPTNGHKITRTSDGGLRINMPGRDYVAGHEPQTLLGGRVESLREYFRDERDRELGRWRWPENPDYVVTPRTQKIKDRRVVRVFRESTGNVNDIREVEPIRRSDDSLNAAHAYFDAHPEKKPWHDAKPGDTWVITTTFHRGEFAVIVTTECELQSANGFCYNPTDTSILSGRRIWQRGKES